ncbi:hypothetical protein [uncultured Leifsonia sp.]|uniref:hypothetical protein n=1 Tax=uncultured Leifsonia sp. TaxID=340359 RepID=UPI0025D0F5EA|nr:hypothetical protein [uncultured Leifsonia sp.]
MRNATTKWVVWGWVSGFAVLAAAVFLIVTFVGHLPEHPTESDARDEAQLVLTDVYNHDISALKARFTSSYPPGPKEFAEQCQRAASDPGEIRVRSNTDFPNAFRVNVDPKSGPSAHFTCAFALIRVDHHWTINYPVGT